MLFYIAFSFYILIGVSIVIRLLLNGMRPTKTLAWLLTIFTIPVGGMFLYLMLGRNRRKNKLFRLKHTPEINSYIKEVQKYHEFITDQERKEHQKIMSLITKNSSFPPSTGNSLRLLKNGNATFQAIFEALEKAKHFIHLEYYIFEEGKLSQGLFELFERKIKKGVAIRILYDGIGSISLNKLYINKLKEIGVEIYKFLPIRFGKFLSSINYRNHRKIIVIDDQIAFTGGINVSDKYVQGDPNLGAWHDMHLQLEGPIVHSLQAIFAMDWYLVSSDDNILKTSYFYPHKNAIGSTAQIVHSGPDSDFSATQHMYFSIINEAQDYVYITNPYIIPGESILDALKVASMSGVDIRLLLSKKSDNAIVKWCVRSYFERLLQAGVKIYLFPEGFVHSKTIVSDDTISSVGTTNLDIRSFEQNYEVNAVIYDDSFAISLKNDFLNDCHKSIQLNYDTFVKRPWHHKLKEGIAKVFSPVL
ncbi:cardiolipin synthase [Aquimarina sp. AD10]|uniref:cardiolipin synthase n=1 Tax=Aquimarina sp. AD10 TaxID=1714849 RepID=UPI000E53D3CC|nr:cardiolipin synthase [Aquimarina sp. AD10]AXT62331.1 cardiolipin synthase [Aquimarina sp. AD10]RKM90473.1 cardiolipin synthase [Aquimarina sp. AD10]